VHAATFDTTEMQPLRHDAGCASPARRPPPSCRAAADREQTDLEEMLEEGLQLDFNILAEDDSPYQVSTRSVASCTGEPHMPRPHPDLPPPSAAACSFPCQHVQPGGRRRLLLRGGPAADAARGDERVPAGAAGRGAGRGRRRRLQLLLWQRQRGGRRRHGCRGERMPRGRPGHRGGCAPFLVAVLCSPLRTLAVSAVSSALAACAKLIEGRLCACGCRAARVWIWTKRLQQRRPLPLGLWWMQTASWWCSARARAGGGSTGRAPNASIGCLTSLVMMVRW